MRLFVQFQELPAPIRYTTIAYITCLLIYNIHGTYADSLQFLTNYRQHSLGDLGLSSYAIEKITNDWEAVRAGAEYHFGERLWDSIIWPITAIRNFVPSIVLALNPPPVK